MLDTDTVSYALRGMGRVAEFILKHRPSQLCISSITLAELRFGANLKKSQRLQRLIGTFISTIDAAPFDAKAADRFGVLTAALNHKGTPIGHMDTLIAAQALTLGVTLVSNNTRHFGHIAGLRTENWL